MSFCSMPEWTEDIVLPLSEQMVCPECGAIAFNAEDVMECLRQSIYYKSRHIPQELVFTCGNPNCNKCDQDFSYKLSVVVSAKPC